MSQVWSWISDIVLALLLVGTLGMTLRLDRALRVVRRDRTSFEALISNLGAATNAVKVGIQALRNEADRAAGQIERRSEEADKMATDLSFLIEAADRAGARLEERLLAVPKIAIIESRPVSVARRLATGGQFLRRRRAQVAATTEASPAVVASAPAEQPAAVSIEHQSPVPAASELPPIGLRERAGITTRPRVLATGILQTLEATKPLQTGTLTGSVIVAETGEELMCLKMVG